MASHVGEAVTSELELYGIWSRRDFVSDPSWRPHRVQLRPAEAPTGAAGRYSLDPRDKAKVEFVGTCAPEGHFAGVAQSRGGHWAHG